LGAKKNIMFFFSVTMMLWCMGARDLRFNQSAQEANDSPAVPARSSFWKPRRAWRMSKPCSEYNRILQKERSRGLPHYPFRIVWPWNAHSCRNEERNLTNTQVALSFYKKNGRSYSAGSWDENYTPKEQRHLIVYWSITET
jgi:hypothetical protein